MADLTVVTYGGGEILQKLFDGSAMLFGNEEAGIIRPLGMIMALIGGFWAISKAFFSPQLDSFFIHYMLPLIAVPCFLMIPTTSVRVEDILKNVSYKVDNVPMFLARVAELTSTIGYRVTAAIESVMHMPNDTSYNATGMIFGAESSLDISKYKLTNATLEQNFNKFTKQCIAYDLALGRYSFDELKKSTDLIKFIKEHTSKVRMIRYFDPKSGDQQGVYLSCLNAAKKFEELMVHERKYFENHELLKHLPLTYKLLTGLSKDSQELINQQIMISAILTKLSLQRAENCSQYF